MNFLNPNMISVHDQDTTIIMPLKHLSMVKVFTRKNALYKNK